MPVERSVETDFVNRITSAFPDEIVKVIFFGSRAKGVEKPGSDYDFVVILKEKKPQTIEAIYEIVTDFLIHLGVDISLKIYKEEETRKMESYPTPFWASVRKTGKELWSQKPSS